MTQNHGLYHAFWQKQPKMDGFCINKNYFKGVKMSQKRSSSWAIVHAVQQYRAKIVQFLFIKAPNVANVAPDQF
jgi:hypothetical protein